MSEHPADAELVASCLGSAETATLAHGLLQEW